MKNIIKTLFLAGIIICVTSCDDDESEGIAAGVIRFPSIILEGDELFFIEEDELFEDPGAKAFLGEEDITDDMVTESSVNTGVPGIYYVNYSSTITNELGQESQATEQRVVIVYPSDPNTTEDLSATYKRTPNGALSVWTKVEDAPGVYTVTNVGGVVPPTSPLLNITAYAFHFANGTATVPEQLVFNGILSADITFTPAGYNIVIHHANFGTNERIFEKQ